MRLKTGTLISFVVLTKKLIFHNILLLIGSLGGSSLRPFLFPFPPFFSFNFSNLSLSLSASSSLNFLSKAIASKSGTVIYFYILYNPRLASSIQNNL